MNPKTKVFDTVRTILGRGFRQSEVDRLDNALKDAFVAPGRDKQKMSETQDQSASNPKAIGEAGIDLIKQFEGCARRRSDGMIEAYPDPGTGGEPWTIGWGATGIGLNGQRIGPGVLWTQEQCDARLERDLVLYARDVARAIGSTLTTQDQFDAMVSFHYNTGAIARATLTKKHVAGDHAGAAREFGRWNKAGGRVLTGLTRRRAAERKLYES